MNEKMFAAGKGDVPNVILPSHGEGAFVYHDRQWFCLL